MRFTVKTKIWFALLSVVLMFTSFVLFYLPAMQGQYLLKYYNNEVQNHAHTVALGVKIAINEQNYEGVQTAMEFVKGDTNLVYVALLQMDTLWTADSLQYEVKKSVFRTFPENYKVDVNATSNDSILIKTSAFETPILKGEIVVGFKKTEIINSKKEIRSSSLMFSGLVLLFGIVIGSWLSTYISKPLLALRDAAIEVGKGDLSQQVDCDTSDEIGELGTAFNSMVGDLAKARKELEERTSDLEVEKKKSDELLVDLKETLANLKEAQEELIRQEKLASIGQLTKGIVDRILNPLNYINNFSLISRELLDEFKEELIKSKSIIDNDDYENLDELVGMVESNLVKINDHGTSASKIVKGMEKLLKEKSTEYIETDINKLVESQMQITMQEVKADLKNTNVDIEKKFDSKRPIVKVLPAELGEVVDNLVRNAIYSVLEKEKITQGYSPSVTVETYLNETFLYIKVKDNGKGIAKSELPHLFSPFFTTKPTSKGTGLGLFMSNDIINLHKGHIAVETKEGEYTEFIVTIPVSKVS